MRFGVAVPARRRTVTAFALLLRVWLAVTFGLVAVLVVLDETEVHAHAVHGSGHRYSS
jgi:hypothetical protein